MDNLEVSNAIIKSAIITTADRGFLDAWLDLDYGGTGQGFGGFCLYLPKSFSHHQLLSPGGHFLYRVMEIAGVVKWDQLPGRAIRVRHSWSRVEAVGHIVKDDWFSPEKDFAELKRDIPQREPK